MVDLADEAIDLALCTGPISNIPGHLAQMLFTFRWVTCASPDYLARRGPPSSPADLSRHDLVAFRNQRTGLVDPWRLRRSGAVSAATSSASIGRKKLTGNGPIRSRLVYFSARPHCGKEGRVGNR
jgi:DNA-binding transcriptional LysR family regulator